MDGTLINRPLWRSDNCSRPKDGRQPPISTHILPPIRLYSGMVVFPISRSLQVLASLALVLLVSCRSPDRFGAGANGSQYDYLGYDQSTLLTNSDGMGYGVGVWVEWDLGNQSQVIEFEWPKSPPWYMREGEAAPAQPTVVVNQSDDRSMDQSVKVDRVDQGVEAAKALNSMGASTQFIILILGLSVVGGIIYLRTRKPHAKADKKG